MSRYIIKKNPWDKSWEIYVNSEKKSDLTVFPVFTTISKRMANAEKKKLEARYKIIKGENNHEKH